METNSKTKKSLFSTSSTGIRLEIARYFIAEHARIINGANIHAKKSLVNVNICAPLTSTLPNEIKKPTVINYRLLS